MRWRRLLVGIVLGVLTVAGAAAQYGGEVGSGEVHLHFEGHVVVTDGSCQQVSQTEIQCQVPAGRQVTITLSATVTPPDYEVKISDISLPPWVGFYGESDTGSVDISCTFSPPSEAAGQSFRLVFEASTVYGLFLDFTVVLDVVATQPPTGPEYPPPGYVTDEQGRFSVPVEYLPNTQVTGVLTQCTVRPLAWVLVEVTLLPKPGRPTIGSLSDVGAVRISTPYGESTVTDFQLLSSMDIYGRVTRTIDVGTVCIMPTGPFVPPTPPPYTQPIEGTTDEEGKFSLSLPGQPGTTVTGRLTECTVRPLPNQEFTLTPIYGGGTLTGFTVAVPGYEPVTITEFGRFSLFGLFTTYSLGDVCLVFQEKVTVLDLQIYKLDGTKLGNDEEGDKKEEETIGSLTCVNIDNDDKDGNFDINDGEVTGEDELVKLVIQKPNGVDGKKKVKLSIVEGADKVRLWEERTKGKEVKLPKEYKVEDLPKTLWIEGVKGSQAVRDIMLKLEPVDFQAQPDQVTLTVIAVTRIEFVGDGNSVKGDDRLDANPNAGGGVRVFPGASKPGEAARDKVKIRVTLSAPVPYELHLFLRAFDVDDPSANGGPIDPNDGGGGGNYKDTTIPYTAEEDNRGNVGGHKEGKLTGQDGDGIATLTIGPGEQQKLFASFQVTKQPGDNFRIAVSCDKDFLKQLRNLDKEDGIEIVDRNNKKKILGWVSPMLTVWRRLHLELDSMAAPGKANTVSGEITAIANIGPGQRRATTNQNLADENQYVPGQLQQVCRIFDLPFFTTFNVTANSTGANSTVTVIDGAGDLQTGSFTLHDDDVDSILPKLPDIGKMEECFKPAYVLPVDDEGGTSGYNNMDVPFDVNTLDREAEGQINKGRKSRNSDDFWVAYIQSVFQGEIDFDRDGENDWETGYCPKCMAGTGQNGAIIYQENITDLARDPAVTARAITRQEIEMATVVHEVGHMFNCKHSDGEIMDGGWPTDVAIPWKFADISLHRIRSTRRPGGGYL